MARCSASMIFLRRSLICMLLFLLSVSVGHATPQSSDWFQYDANHQLQMKVELFLSSTCPQCHNVDKFFHMIEKDNPWLVVHRYIINQDKSALRHFNQRLEHEHVDAFTVPAIFFCDSHWAGFSVFDKAGKALIHGMNDCYQKRIEQGALTTTTVQALQRQGAANQTESQLDDLPTGFKFVFFSAFYDAVTICNLFCFVAFVSFLCLLSDQKLGQLGAGAVFIVILGMMHYVQQAHSYLYYHSKPGLMLYTMVIGVLLLVYVSPFYQKWLVSKRLKSTKQTLIMGAVTLAMVYFYQQTCSLNVAMIFEHWLIEQTNSNAVYWLYALCYQICYLLPLILVLLVFYFFDRHPRLMRYHQMSRIFARLILLSIGVLLMVNPAALANVIVFYGVCFSSALVTWIILRRQKGVV